MDVDAPADASVLAMDMLSDENAAEVRQQLEKRQRELDEQEQEASSDPDLIEFEVEGFAVRLSQPSSSNPQGTVEVHLQTLISH